MGALGTRVQRACVWLTPQAFVFSRLHASRLAAEGLRRPPIALAGLVGPALQAHGDPVAARDPLVVFAGRHIPEKRVEAIPAAIEAGRRILPGLRAVVLGDGPRRDALLAEIKARRLEDVVSAPGFIPVPDVQSALEEAACLVLPSSREGYGLVVVEAAAAATPSVVVRGVDNAAVELIEEGVNGTVAESVEPAELGAAIVRVIRGRTRPAAADGRLVRAACAGASRRALGANGPRLGRVRVAAIPAPAPRARRSWRGR